MSGLQGIKEQLTRQTEKYYLFKQRKLEQNNEIKQEDQSKEQISNQVLKGTDSRFIVHALKILIAVKY